MKKIRIGGWTRIWIVVSLIALAYALIGMPQDLRTAQYAADDVVRTDASWRAKCDELREKKAAGTFATWDESPFVECSVDHSDLHSETASKEIYRDRIADAYLNAFWAIVIPSGVVGATFLTIGWIWKGFRRRTST